MNISCLTILKNQGTHWFSYAFKEILSDLDVSDIPNLDHLISKYRTIFEETTITYDQNDNKLDRLSKLNHGILADMMDNNILPKFFKEQMLLLYDDYLDCKADHHAQCRPVYEDNY